MKVLNARVLLVVSVLFFLFFGLAERALAEAPILAQLGESHGHRDRAHGQKPFFHHRGADSLTRAKEEAAIFTPTLLTSPRGALVSSTTVTGLDGIDENSTLADPPDGAIAVSGGYIVEAVNDALSVWTKTYDASGKPTVTAAISAADLNLFFGNNPNCYTGANDFFGLVSDPSLDYDVAHDRFMLSMISFDQLFLTSSLCVAVTTTGDPRGNWFVYAFPISPGNALLDFPRAVIGTDGQIYLAGNLFLFDALGNATFDHARVYAFKTSDMYAGSNTSPSVRVVGNDPQTGLPADSLTPARAVGVSGMYFVSASNPAPSVTGSAITLWKWSAPFGSNLFTQQGAVTVAAYAQPPQALQPGALADCSKANANCLATNDARNLTAYWFNNTVWAAHNIGCTQGGSPVACVQWYQLGNLDGPPALLQQGTVDDSQPGHYRYFPSLAVDQNGNVALAYAYSSATDYAGIRSTTISSGALASETVLKAGEATFISTRYGDYAATALDPHDNLTIWHTEEYTKNLAGVSEWGTWVSAIQIASTAPTGDFTIAAAPTSPVTVVPGTSGNYTVTISALSGLTGTVTLSVSGLPAGASGSFSPSAVTFTSGGPTSATATLTVTTTTTTPPGNYSLTITGSWAGLLRTSTATLAVQDFSLSVTPSSRTVSRGSTTSYTVTVNSINGFSAPVSFTSLSGMPSGVTYSPKPLPTAVTPGASVTLTLSASTTTRRGTYTLTITAKGAGVSRRASFQLTVR